MRNRYGVAVVAALISVLPLASAGARGLGGITWGQEVFESSLSDSDLGSRLLGVYGYDVDHSGRRTGAFALAIYSDASPPVAQGGFLGCLVGQELRQAGTLMAVNLWAGVGGLTAGRGVPSSGSFAGFAELSGEIGVTVMPGLLLTGYAGLQAMSAISSHEAFFSRVMYSPILGVRIAWGS